MPTIPYNDAFYDHFTQDALRSARLVIPHVLRYAPAQSVLDVGCGRGEWLSAFLDNGVADIHGLDGGYVSTEKLLIDPVHFEAVDLLYPPAPARSYDLAVCVEVGEHLPTRCSAPLVQLLTGAAPVVLFSAAIPGQGGVRHINEQWPLFWNSLFEARGFSRFDVVRPHIWRDQRIQYYYRQNVYLFASLEAVKALPLLQEDGAGNPRADLDLIHPAILSRYQTFSGLLRELPGAFWRSVQKRWMGGPLIGGRRGEK